MPSPSTSVPQQAPAGMYQLSSDPASGADNAYLQTPEVAQYRDLRRLSPRSQRYLDKPISRQISGNAHAMAPLLEHVALPEPSQYPYPRPSAALAHRPSLKGAQHRTPGHQIERTPSKRRQQEMIARDDVSKATSPIGKHNSLPRHANTVLADRDIQSDVEYLDEPAPAQHTHKYP